MITAGERETMTAVGLINLAIACAGTGAAVAATMLLARTWNCLEARLRERSKR